MLQFFVTYRIYHLRLDLSTGEPRLRSNRLVRAQLYAKTDGCSVSQGRVLRQVRNRSVLENASKLLLPHLLAPNEVKAQVFSQPAERATPQVRFFTKIRQ